ncbi:uncharacterized protein [Epargyreus clarus]|uniref:uncharacterized protein n=1 Tax=Epargyreus clarus TaxID=520877 RepID=UPI003C2D79B8
MSDSSSDAAQTAGSRNDDHVTTRRVKKMRPSPAAARREDDDGMAEMTPRPRFHLKVPPFSPEDPEKWFALEGQFANFGITDDAEKFTQVTINLDVVHAKAVKDVIVNPPARNRYKKIKELGDRKPSQFLRHLQDLAGPSVPTDFVKTIWSHRLPSNVQTVLASQPTLAPEQLADLADNILDIVTSCSVAATSYTAPYPSPSSEMAELRKMVEQLSLKVDENGRLLRHYADRSSPLHRPSRYRSRSQKSPGSRSRSNSNHLKHPLCWYPFKGQCP